MNTYSKLTSANNAKSSSLEKLSSGLRINRAGDDAAGLAISEKMRGQISGLNQAAKNAQDGISLIQTAEGALSETHSILQRMRELAVQSSNDTNTAVDRNEIQKEVDELAKEITRIGNNTEFNTQKLINGGITDTKFHIGANKGQDISLSINAMDAFSLGVSGDSMEATLAGSGSVSAATVTGSGAAVFDGNVVTASVAEVAGSLATSGKLAGTYAGEAGDLKLKIDGTEVTVALLDTDDIDGATTKINDAINATLGTSGEEYAVKDGGEITINSLTTGTDSSVEVTDAFAGFAVGSNAGEAAVATTYTVTLSDGTGANSVIAGLAADAASVAGTGDFAGFNLTLDGTLAHGESNTITLGVTTAGKATFNLDGTINEEAVTGAGIDVSSQTAASDAIETIQKAIETVSAERSKLGATQNRLDHTINNLTTTSENLTAAESRIRDVDMAKEMMDFTKNNILSQAATSMLAQANQMPQSVLQLLQ